MLLLCMELSIERRYMCISVMFVMDYASWRVKATLRYCFKTLDRKPRPRSQSYTESTTVGPDKYPLRNTCAVAMALIIITLMRVRS